MKIKKKYNGRITRPVEWSAYGEGIELFLVLIAGMTSGGLAAVIAREASDRELLVGTPSAVGRLNRSLLFIAHNLCGAGA